MSTLCAGASHFFSLFHFCVLSCLTTLFTWILFSCCFSLNRLFSVPFLSFIPTLLISFSSSFPSIQSYWNPLFTYKPYSKHICFFFNLILRDFTLHSGSLALTSSSNFHFSALILPIFCNSNPAVHITLLIFEFLFRFFSQPFFHLQVTAYPVVIVVFRRIPVLM